MKKVTCILLFFLLALLLSGNLLACSSPPQAVTWRMATSWAADNPFYTQAAQAICEKVKALSGGRLLIEPYPAGSIVDAMGVMDAVSSGKVEIGHSWSGYWTNHEGSFELFTSIPDQMVSQEWIVWLYGPSRGIDLWEELYAKYNIVPFPGGLSGPEFGLFTNVPVRTLTDFQGLRLRVAGLAADVLQELGASTVLVAPDEIKNAFQKGEIDGFEFSTPAIDWSMGFQKVCHYASLPSWHQPSATLEVIVNQDAFRKLPDDLKNVLESACKEVGLIDYLARTEGENAEYFDRFAQAGIQINTLDASALEKINEITNRLVDEHAARDDFYARVIQSQRDFLARYRTWEYWSDFKLYSGQSEAERVFNLIEQNIRNEIARLDRDMTTAALALSGMDLRSNEARNILSGLLEGRPYGVDVATVDRNGIILALEPAEYHEFEGADISQQEQVIRLFRTGKPVLSQNFMAVEGFEAADFEYPIFSSSHELVGSVSFLFKPDVILREFILPLTGSPTFNVWAMQPDGRVIYEEDEDEIGKNTFEDPLYRSFPQILALVKQMGVNESGVGQYEFLDTGLQNIVRKEARWVTLDLHGTQWRLILSRVLP